MSEEEQAFYNWYHGLKLEPKESLITHRDINGYPLYPIRACEIAFGMGWNLALESLKTPTHNDTPRN